MRIKPILSHLHRHEAGITALETAIVLIAFIISAAVFAFAILNAGTFSTERGSNAIYSGLGEVQSAIELKGDLVAQATITGTAGTIDSITFVVGNAVGGEPLDMTDTTNGRHTITLSFRDDTQHHTNLAWQTSWLVHDGDPLLERGELVEITIPNLSSQLTTDLSTNHSFTLELKPPKGSTLVIQRTTPPHLYPVQQLR